MSSIVKIVFAACCVTLAGLIHSAVPETSMFAAGVLSFTVLAVVFGIVHKISCVVLGVTPPEPPPSASERNQFPSWFNTPS